jgi:hypothetical protein
MDKIFTNGLWFKEWAEPMPKFIKGKLSIKVPDFIKFLEDNQNNSGYVNINIKTSQKGTVYCELDTWKPTQDKAKVEETKEPIIDPIDGSDLSDSPF